MMIDYISRRIEFSLDIEFEDDFIIPLPNSDFLVFSCISSG